MITTGQASTPAVIRQVGAGSVAEAQLLPTFQSLRALGGFSDPRANQATTYLFEGRLDKLNAADLGRILQADRTSASNATAVLKKLDQLASSIQSSTIAASAFHNLPSGSKTFVADWNQFLSATVAALHGARRALADTRPVLAETRSLAAPAYATAPMHSTVQFDKVRRAVTGNLLVLYQRLQAAMRGLAVGEKFISFVNGNQEAQAIVTKVNQDYANGFLAQQFTSR